MRPHPSRRFDNLKVLALRALSEKTHWPTNSHLSDPAARLESLTTIIWLVIRHRHQRNRAPNRSVSPSFCKPEPSVWARWFAAAFNEAGLEDCPRFREAITFGGAQT